MMEGLAALNRRTKPPMRIIQDRAHEQNKKILWGEVKRGRRDLRRSTRNAHNQKCRHGHTETNGNRKEKNKSGKRHKQLEKAYQQARNKKQAEKQWNEEIEVEKQTDEADQRGNMPTRGSGRK